MKLNKLFLLLLALPLAFVACEPNEPIETPTDPAVLTLTSENSLQFTPEGGNGTITYTLENAVAGTELTATTTAEWITDITVGETITFVVAANESTQKRNDRILVTYGTENFNVFVKQEGVEPVVNFEAQNFLGVYYGTEYSPNYNMAIYLSDLGFTEQGYVLAGGTYYTLDLFMDNEPAIDAEGFMTVPAGTYTFDGTDSYGDMTIGYAYSSYFKINSDASAYE
ncbi:MAG: BACON domain-containing protein, partial [Alistipes sp.]|nr:BACON domain-containing protein [Alistipes sp.]